MKVYLDMKEKERKEMEDALIYHVCLNIVKDMMKDGLSKEQALALIKIYLKYGQKKET